MIGEELATLPERLGMAHDLSDGFQSRAVEGHEVVLDRHDYFARNREVVVQQQIVDLRDAALYGVLNGDYRVRDLILLDGLEDRLEIWKGPRPN